MPAQAASTKSPETPAHPALSSWAINRKLEELERGYGRDQKKKAAEIESSSIGNPRGAAIAYMVERLERYVEEIESVYKAEIEASRVADSADLWAAVYWHKVLPSMAAKINSLMGNAVFSVMRSGGDRPGEQAAVEEAQRRLSRLRTDIERKLASALENAEQERTTAGDNSVSRAAPSRQVAPSNFAPSLQNPPTLNWSDEERIRAGVMFSAIERGLKGLDYCNFLYEYKVCPPQSWIDDEGCLDTYPKAYHKSEKWRIRIRKEKSRKAALRDELDQSHPHELERIRNLGKQDHLGLRDVSEVSRGLRR